VRVDGKRVQSRRQLGRRRGPRTDGRRSRARRSPRSRNEVPASCHRRRHFHLAGQIRGGPDRATPRGFFQGAHSPTRRRAASRTSVGASPPSRRGMPRDACDPGRLPQARRRLSTASPPQAARATRRTAGLSRLVAGRILSRRLPSAAASPSTSRMLSTAEGETRLAAHRDRRTRCAIPAPAIVAPRRRRADQRAGIAGGIARRPSDRA